MSDQSEGEKPEIKPQDGSEIQPPALGPDGEPFDAERAKATIEKLRGFEKEARAAQKKLEAYEKAERERKDAELSETEKLKRELAAAQAQLKASQLDNMKRTIAAAVGLPAPLAARLQGDDEETLKADALALLESLPKAEPKKPTLPVTNPGNNAGGGDTEAQRRARIYSPGGNMYDPATAQKLGGGVFVLDKNNQGD